MLQKNTCFSRVFVGPENSYTVIIPMEMCIIVENFVFVNLAEHADICTISSSNGNVVSQKVGTFFRVLLLADFL